MRKEAWYKTGGRTEASAPTEAQQEVQWTGDRKGRPYESVTRGVRKESPRHGFAVPAPLGKGAKGMGMRIATTSDIGHWFRNDRGFFKGCGVRDDVGSESSAAGGG